MKVRYNVAVAKISLCCQFTIIKYLPSTDIQGLAALREARISWTFDHTLKGTNPLPQVQLVSIQEL